jgi:hypothetical protein
MFVSFKTPRVCRQRKSPSFWRTRYSKSYAPQILIACCSDLDQKLRIEHWIGKPFMLEDLPKEITRDDVRIYGYSVERTNISSNQIAVVADSSPEFRQGCVARSNEMSPPHWANFVAAPVNFLEGSPKSGPFDVFATNPNLSVMAFYNPLTSERPRWFDCG